MQLITTQHTIFQNYRLGQACSYVSGSLVTGLMATVLQCTMAITHNILLLQAFI